MNTTIQELTEEEMVRISGGNYGGEFVGGCVTAVAGAAIATGGMSIPLAAQTCLAGGTIGVIGAASKDLWSYISTSMEK